MRITNKIGLDIVEKHLLKKTTEDDKFNGTVLHECVTDYSKKIRVRI